jgi:hypothetical protein
MRKKKRETLIAHVMGGRYDKAIKYAPMMETRIIAIKQNNCFSGTVQETERWAEALSYFLRTIPKEFQ